MDYKASLDAKPGTNSYINWNAAGKKFRSSLDAILQAPLHTIICMRSKQDYILELDIKGRQVPRKVGLAPVMRPDIEYEFTVLLDGDAEHYVTASKDRTELFVDQRFQITPETGEKLLEWLNAAPPPEPEPSTQEQLASELADIEPETLTAYLIARGASPDGNVMSVSNEYAQKALAAIPRLRAGIDKFRQEATPNGAAEPATNK